MKLTYEDEYSKITIESDSVLIHDVMQEIKRLLIAVGFQPENIREYIEDE